MKLNEEQERAVQTLDGPVLVVAGPGTGKTQLLAARVANILAQTDADPSNILCLTFTNDGARNMRERLRGMIGEVSYKVTVGTYHEFGNMILRDYPEYFLERRYLTLLDELKSYQIFQGLVEAMSYTNALRYKEWRGVRSLVSDVKQAALTPGDLRQIAKANQQIIEQLETVANEIFPARMPSQLAQIEPLFARWREALEAIKESSDLKDVPSLAATYLVGLEQALDQAAATGKTTPLNKYKQELMERVEERFRLKAAKANQRLLALAEVYEQYNQQVQAAGLYDFDDIILAAIAALEEHVELRAELQERYQYVLLDEYQDTNAAQSRLVELLLDNPVWEGRPNVLAVGDDDQAIYAFQGALASNLADFQQRYRDVALIYLTKNYRSGAGIVDFAASFRQTISDGVFKDKQLELANQRSATIERLDFKSELAERNWVAERVRELLAEGVAAEQIAILARTNAELDSVAKHLQGVKLRYDRQNDILTEQPAVRELLDLSRLLVVIREQAPLENALAAQVFYQDGWQLPVGELYQVARAAKEAGGWLAAMLASAEPRVKTAAETVITLAGRLVDLPLAEAVAALAERWQADDATAYSLNSALLILTKALEARQDEVAAVKLLPTLRDLVQYADAMLTAGLNLLDASPYRLGEQAVSLLTAHKAKGLEFEQVFLIGAHNTNWVKNNSHRGSTLPANLAAIHPSGDRDDDQRRLLYVAATRAKEALYITRAQASFDGARRYEPIEYFDERDENGQTVALALPAAFRTVRLAESDQERPAATVILQELQRLQTSPDLARIAEQFRAEYVLTASDVITFADSEYGGAAKFYRDRVLKCPQAPNRVLQFGTLIHAVLEDAAAAANRGAPFSEAQLLAHFRQAAAGLDGLAATERRLILEQGEFVLPRYLAARPELFRAANVQAEKWFRREHQGVRMWGKVDRIESDGKSWTVVDFKTGKAGGLHDEKTYRAILQLYIYKLLIGEAARLPVKQGRVEFVSADAEGKVGKPVELAFAAAEESLVWQLIEAVWRRIMAMDFREVPATAAASDFATYLTAKLDAIML